VLTRQFLLPIGLAVTLTLATSACSSTDTSTGTGAGVAPPSASAALVSTAPAPTAASAGVASATTTDKDKDTDAASGVGAVAAGDAAKGHDSFVKVCATCHGPDGKGLPGLGKDLHNNKFVASKSDAEMVAFITHGRDTSDPLNTTGVAMPPKGGNPAFTDADLANIVAFVRTLK
jgi:mono/diheme cytochrome c family protein